jgi:hypothetical protein
MRRLSYFGLAGGLLHLLILGYTVHLVLGRGAADWPMYWTLFLALDFPVSLGVLPVTWLAPPAGGGPLADVTNFWWPLAFHGVVGTAWWYIVGLAIERRLRPRQPEAAQPGATRSDESGPGPAAADGPKAPGA